MSYQNCEFYYGWLGTAHHRRQTSVKKSQKLENCDKARLGGGKVHQKVQNSRRNGRHTPTRC